MANSYIERLYQAFGKLFVRTINGKKPNEVGDVPIDESDITAILGYTPLQEAPVTSVDGKKGDVDLSGTYQPKGNYVTSVNGKTGAVTIEASASGRGVGRGGFNIGYYLTSSNAKNGYTVPSSGIISINCSCDKYGVDVYINGVKQYTQPYTKESSVDEGGDASSIVYYYYANWEMPVNEGETIILVDKGLTPTQSNGAFVRSFSGTLMQLVVV